MQTPYKVKENKGDWQNLAKWGFHSNDFAPSGKLKIQKKLTILDQCIFNMIDPYEVAKKYGVSRKSIQSWAHESGRQLPTYDQFQLFKDAKARLGDPLDTFTRCEKCMDPFEKLDLFALIEHIKTSHITTSMII